MHIRNLPNTNTILWDDVRVAGTNNVVVNVDVNLATGWGTCHAKTQLVPDGVDGTWEISGHGKFFWGVGASGYAIGHGMGALKGLNILMAWGIGEDTTGCIFDPRGK